MGPDLTTLERATSGLDAPFAVVDLDAFDRNAADLLRRAGGRPVRLATKSVRCRGLQERALAAGLRGELCFTLPEALWLAGHGHEDLVVAYPTTDRVALAALPGPPVTVTVDDIAHLDRCAPGTRVCLDVDAGWWPLRGRVRVGAKRSPVRTPGQAAALARAARERGLVVDGLMAYEAQIAGVPDAPPRRLEGVAIRLMQALSARELRGRRGRVVAAVRREVPLRFVNGGGTGSLERTAADPAVTELAAGSGLYAPHLFDRFRAFRAQPAAFFALPVVRRPARGVATVLGGGLLASGPGAADRLPVPVHPAGLALDPREGAGEVQTPLLGAVADRLRVGDRVWFRHAKAGELCERFDELVLVRGGAVDGRLPTYRGEGAPSL